MQPLRVAVRGPKELDWLKTGPGGKEMGFCKEQNVPNTCNGMKGHTHVRAAPKAPEAAAPEGFIFCSSTKNSSESSQPQLFPFFTHNAKRSLENLS